MELKKPIEVLSLKKIYTFSLYVEFVCSSKISLWESMYTCT